MSRRRKSNARPRRPDATPQALLAAALALPGVAAAPAHAAAPEESVVGFKVLTYRDWQPGESRMKVTAPSAYIAKTLPQEFVVQGSATVDSISGASPLYHSTLSGASGKGIHDLRRAADLKVTKYFERIAIGVAGAYSKEHDFLSRSASVDVRIFSADNNTTYSFGIGSTGDTINSTNGVAIDRHRKGNDFMVGITRVLTANDIVQANLTYAKGTGYYDDPYKSIDVRPDHRNQLAALVRWNHHFDSLDASSRLSYRYYTDSFGVKSMTFGGEWVQSVGERWTVIPSLRYYSQSAADFYYDPPFPTGYTGANFYSADQRLSAFGAFTPGLKLVREFQGGWVVDLKAEYYEQRGAWRLQGQGSPGLAPFRATFYQFGVAKRF